MKVKDILYAIDQGTQNLGSFIYLSFTPKEVLLQFNTIANYYCRRHFSAILPAEFKPLFEGVRLNIDDLRYLKLIDVSCNAGTDNVCAFPQDYAHFSSAHALGKYCEKDVISNVREYGTSFSYDIITNSLTKPKPSSLVGAINQNQIKVYIPEKYELKSIKLTYIRKVKEYTDADIDNDYKEYPYDVVLLLIDLTVKRLLEITQSPRYQTKTIETNS